MDRLDSMNVFVTVAELRSFAAAAKRLRRSPSVVTRQVAALEGHLGARLLQRTTRSVALTSAGERYLDRARRILADVTEAETAAQADRTAPAGRFVVAAPNVFGRLHVAPAMLAFLRRYPEVIGELTLSDHNANLVEQGIDAAVRIGALDDSSLVARMVGATRRVWVASPAYLAAHKRMRTPEDAAASDVIQFTAINPIAEWRFARDGHDRRVTFRPGLVTNSADAAIGYASAGGGVTMVLSYQVADAVRAGRLRVILAGYEPPPLPIHVVYPTARLLSAKVRAFLELIAARDWRFVEL